MLGCEAYLDGLPLAPIKDVRTLRAPVDLNVTIVVTLVLRASRKAQEFGAKLLSGDTTPLSREEAEEITSADPKDRKAVLIYLADSGLHVTSEDKRARRICVRGTIGQMNAVFGVSMGMKQDSLGHEYLSYEGQIVMPVLLQRIVEAVLGLDAHAIAKSRPEGSQEC